MMKKIFRLCFFVLLAAAVACAPRERTLVVLSTNDMHAKIQNFPRLAAAVEACRDTAQLVLLVDAGDRWTGNAYVDMCATPGKPVIELMNRLGYDVATLGNHEFDHGQAFLGRMIDSMDFEVVCANVVSDTCTFPQLPPYTIVERDGLKIGVVGAVTNYEGPGHPAGHKTSFVGLRFPDPQQEAAKYAEELRGQVDVLLLLSHMGDDRDEELLTKGVPFDAVIGGHTHVERNSMIGGVLLTQTGRNLMNIGVTTIRLRGKQVQEVAFRTIPLSEYEPEEEYADLVAAYYDDPQLNAPVGEFARTIDKAGLGNWMASSIARKARTDLGIYHVGGVRLDSIAGGGVGKARVYDLEPFGTKVAVMRMTPAQLRRMIVTKYNEPTREGHRIDLIMTTPYTIEVDGEDRAYDVVFPELREGRVYSIALSDYIFRNYKGLEYADGRVTPLLVADVLLEELRERSPLVADNTLHHSIVRP